MQQNLGSRDIYGLRNVPGSSKLFPKPIRSPKRRSSPRCCRDDDALTYTKPYASKAVSSVRIHPEAISDLWAFSDSSSIHSSQRFRSRQSFADGTDGINCCSDPYHASLQPSEAVKVRLQRSTSRSASDISKAMAVSTSLQRPVRRGSDCPITRH